MWRTRQKICTTFGLVFVTSAKQRRWDQINLGFEEPIRCPVLLLGAGAVIMRPHRNDERSDKAWGLNVEGCVLKTFHQHKRLGLTPVNSQAFCVHVYCLRDKSVTQCHFVFRRVVFIKYRTIIKILFSSRNSIIPSWAQLERCKCMGESCPVHGHRGLEENGCNPPPRATLDQTHTRMG